jgi:hypothetical protein
MSATVGRDFTPSHETSADTGEANAWEQVPGGHKVSVRVSRSATSWPPSWAAS